MRTFPHQYDPQGNPYAVTKSHVFLVYNLHLSAEISLIWVKICVFLPRLNVCSTLDILILDFKNDEIYQNLRQFKWGE